MNLHWMGILAASGLCSILPLGGEYCERIDLVKQAVSGDAKASAVAIEALRAKGAPGLDALLEEFDKASDKAPYKDVIDKVAGQKDAAYSRLFWHTDLAQAKRRAQSQDKPILSLRLLGKLDEELSCANSRFFRTVLYCDPEISKILRERFVLHWESVRPVPKIFVDFGDGRRLERTIAGNSFHYILYPDGTPFDLIPGLLGPKPFLAQLEQVTGLFGEIPAERLVGPNLANELQRCRTLHMSWKGETEKRCAADLARVGANALDESSLARVAALRPEFGQLSPTSFGLVSKKLSADSFIAVSKTMEETPLLRAVRNFRETLAADTVRNEYDLHPRIHQWFIDGWMHANDLKTITERVYRELFLTPLDDPFLGLVPADRYSAIPNEGNVVVK